MLSTFKCAFITLSLCFSMFQSCHHLKAGKTGNPYIDAKEKPSDKQRKQEKKQMKTGEKAYKDQIKKNKENIREGRNSMSTKPQYKQTTKTGRRKKKYGYHF